MSKDQMRRLEKLEAPCGAGPMPPPATLWTVENGRRWSELYDKGENLTADEKREQAALTDAWKASGGVQPSALTPMDIVLLKHLDRPAPKGCSNEK
jgi:hypothetical protein